MGNTQIKINSSRCMYFKVVHFSDKLQTLTYNIGHDAAIMIVDKNVEEATLMSSAHEL